MITYKMFTFGEIHNIVKKLGFGTPDFLTSRDGRNNNRPISCISDVCDILILYGSDLKSSKPNKINDKKMLQLESTLTKCGMEKFNKAKHKIKLSIVEKKVCQKDIFCWKSDYVKDAASLCKDTNVIDFKKKQMEFISKMHMWGNYEENDRRYYLHMIFRFYLNEYHKRMVERDIVVEFPSYQYILDNISPNGCKNGFPPEFVRFLNDSAGRDFEVKTLPVPIKGCGKNVTFETNFENIPEVSSFRRMIYNNFIKWDEYNIKYKTCIYPEYLFNGNINNKIVVNAALKFRKTKNVTVNIHKLDNIDSDNMNNIIKIDPRIKDLYEKYSTHSFKTSGEQLNERYGFFIFHRSYFYCMNGKTEHFFKETDSRMDIYMNFQLFCDPASNINSINTDESTIRSMLIFFKDISYVFYLYSNVDILSDKVNLLKDCIENLS